MINSQQKPNWQQQQGQNINSGMLLDDPLYDGNSFPPAGMFGARNTSAQQPTFMDRVLYCLIASSCIAAAALVVIVGIAVVSALRAA